MKKRLISVLGSARAYFDWSDVFLVSTVSLCLIGAGLCVNGTMNAQASPAVPKWEVQMSVWPHSAPGPGWEPFAADHGYTYWRRAAR